MSLHPPARLSASLHTPDGTRAGCPLGRRAWLLRAAAAFASTSLAVAAARGDPADALTGPNMPYDAFDALPAERIEVEGGVIRLAFGRSAFDLPRARLRQYVVDAARSVSTYYGRFPAADTRLLIVAAIGPGRPVRSGRAFGYRGAAIKLTLAEDVSERHLADDWILVHEMTHLALPSLPDRQHWLEEGVASYVEPLARAQAGDLAVERVWRGMLDGMPKGLPQPGDRGLDHTPTWGRTYWGGALFCLLADVEIRERSGNAKGLQHALRAILADAGNMERRLDIDRVLGLGDAGIGLPVLADLYARMKDSPYPVDLQALWQRLGVHGAGGVVTLDDRAPLAAVRRALTAPFSA